MRCLKVVAGACATAFVSACANAGPHNDVLIFGTDTRLAVDVSTPVAAGGTPEVTIGYKRREAVWLPLIVNGQGQVAVDQKNSAGSPERGPNDAGAGVRETELYQGSAKDRLDAYSVFASFGANLRGSRNQTGSEATAGLAQFFATGVAAQHLGANTSIGQALSVQPATAAAAAAKSEAAAANARASAAEERAELVGRLAADAGKTAVDVALNTGRDRATQENLAAARIEACVAHDKAKFTTLIDQLVAADSANADLKRVVDELKVATTADERRNAIEGEAAIATTIALQCKGE